MSSNSERTSATLLIRVQQRDPDSWRRLFDVYGAIVYRWCRRWGVPTSDAEDIVQDVFRRVARSVENFHRDEKATFRGWLWTIARNTANDYFTRRATRPLASGGTTQNLQLHQIPMRDEASEAEKSDDRLRILRALLETIRGDFQPRTWEIFERSVLRGEDTETIARDVGLSLHSVRQAKHRVLQRLREECQGMLD